MRRLINKTIFSFLTAVAVLGPLSAAADNHELISAYVNRNYQKAIDLADKRPDNPEAILIKALSLLHDKKECDIKTAFRFLAELLKNKSLPKELYLQAATALARTTQLMQRRPDIYPEAKGVEWKRIYKDILNKYPNSNYACLALVYSTVDDFSSGDKEKVSAAFKTLEHFCAKFKGNPEVLVPVHMLADFEYIARRGDYNAAFKHLKAACGTGISSPKLRETSLFRLAYMCRTKLHNKRLAEKYYLEFIKQYPHSRYVPVIRKYLSELRKSQGQAHEPK
jgi:outer membrane protein assembly factor BamD (BamD/ComL family)